MCHFSGILYLLLIDCEAESLWAEALRPKGCILMLRTKCATWGCSMIPILWEELEAVRLAVGCGNEASSNPSRAPVTSTRCWAHFSITVFILSLRCARWWFKHFGGNQHCDWLWRGFHILLIEISAPPNHISPCSLLLPPCLPVPCQLAWLHASWQWPMWKAVLEMKHSLEHWGLPSCSLGSPAAYTPCLRVGG